MRAGAKTGARDKRKANKRGAARLAAVQALYQMDLAGTGINEILAEFESHWLGAEVEGANYLPAEAAFFRDIVGGVVREQTTLDPVCGMKVRPGTVWLSASMVVMLRISRSCCVLTVTATGTS